MVTIFIKIYAKEYFFNKEGEFMGYDLENESNSLDVQDFHKKRIAFIIYDNKVFYMKDTILSHWEFAQTLGISKEVFDTLCRGYYLDEKLIFYKGNFEYDDDLIDYAKEYFDEIKAELNLEKVNIYFGQKIGKIGEAWPPDYYYGEI